jgi:hypothetical protein
MKLLPVTSLLLATPLLAQQFPEVESNDTPASAQAFALGQQCNANLTAGELDWYAFTTSGGYHLITTSGGAAAGTDTTLALYDATGTTALAFNDDSVSVVSALNLDIPAGSYLLRVKGFSATSAGAYALDVSLPMSKPYTGNEVEPNDTLATASIVVDGDQILASLTPPTLAVLADSVAAATVVLSNTVTTSSTTVITPVVPPVLGAYNGVGYFVRFTSGVNAGLTRRLTTATATTITTEAWPAASGAGDTFDIVSNSVTVLADAALAGSTTSVLNASVALPAGAYIAPGISHAVRFLTGANAGLSRTVTGNSATTITTSAWPVAPAAGDSYVVVAGGGTTSVVPTGALVAGQYSDQRHWMRCTSGTNVGLTRCISTNTAQYITLVTSFPNAMAPGDTYEIDRYDADTYRIDVTSPKALVVFSVTEGTAPWVSGWSYEVLDSAGVRIPVTLGTGLADSPATAPDGRVSSFRVWTLGTYYVRIFQRRNALTGDDNLVPYGNYRFEAKIRLMNLGGSVAEVEPNSTAPTATPLAPGQDGTGNITSNTGADPTDLWGPFTFTSQTLMTFQVSAAATATPLTDATINLRQVLDPTLGTLSAGTAVTGGNTLEPSTLNPRGNFNFLLQGTTYYLEVASAGTGVGQSGDYVLEVAFTDTPTYTAGNWSQVAANASGCGTAGVPTITRVMGGATGTYGELPLVGQTMTTRVSNLNGVGNFGLMAIGTSGILGPSFAPAGTPESVYNPQPLDLTLAGAPGCTLNVNPELVEVLFGDVSGNADYVLAIPGVPALAGAVLFLQPAKWDFTVNALGIQTGNWARIIVGRRSF